MNSERPRIFPLPSSDVNPERQQTDEYGADVEALLEMSTALGSYSVDLKIPHETREWLWEYSKNLRIVAMRFKRRRRGKVR